MTEPYLYNKVDSTRERAKIVRKCPKCGNKMGFGFEHGTDPESTETDFWWCPKCGHEQKLEDLSKDRYLSSARKLKDGEKG